MNEARKAHPRDPEPSAARLAPRAFSAGVVDSLGWGFVWTKPNRQPFLCPSILK